MNDVAIEPNTPRQSRTLATTDRGILIVGRDRPFQQRDTRSEKRHDRSNQDNRPGQFFAESDANLTRRSEETSII